MFLHALIFFLQAEFSAYWQHNKNFKQRCGKIAKYKLCLLNGEGIYQSETDVDAQTTVCLLICQNWSTKLNHFSACCLLCFTFWNFEASEAKSWSNVSFYKYDWPQGFVSFNSPLSKHPLLFWICCMVCLGTNACILKHFIQKAFLLFQSRDGIKIYCLFDI